MVAVHFPACLLILAERVLPAATIGASVPALGIHSAGCHPEPSSWSSHSVYSPTALDRRYTHPPTPRIVRSFVSGLIWLLSLPLAKLLYIKDIKRRRETGVFFWRIPPF